MSAELVELPAGKRTSGILRPEVMLQVFLSICVVFLLLGAVAGCGPSATEPETSTFAVKGNVVLDDGGDPAAAEIRLFASPEDDQIAAALASYPLIGFGDYQPLLFDPLNEQPLQTASPGSDGSFSFQDVAPGSYIVEAALTGYGCPEPVPVNLSGDADIGTLVLARETEVIGNITQDQTWHTGETRVIGGDIIVLAGVTLTIEPGVLVLLKGDYEIKVFGVLAVDGTVSQPVRFRRHSDDYAPGDDWKGIRVEIGAGDCRFTGMVMQNAATALEIKDGETTLSECLFDAPETIGVFFSTQSSGEAKYCILRDGDVGLRANLTDPEFSFNLILRMSGAGIEVQDSSQADIHDNVILDCDRGIRSSWFTAPVIRYNLIEGGSRAVDAERGFDAVIQYNVFTGQSGETVYFSIGYCYPEPFSYNNFLNAPLHILYVSGSAAQQSDTVFAQFNYWDGEDPEQIPVRIIDGYDHGTQANPIGIVVYNPLLDEPVTTAGP